MVKFGWLRTLQVIANIAILFRFDLVGAVALGWYCLLFIPAMGANGIIEGFVVAVASPKEVKLYSIWLVLCTVSYWVAAIAFGGEF
jgi:hypothetical protein